MKIEGLDSLNWVLKEKDDEIYDLKEKLKKLEYQLDTDLHFWKMEKKMPKDDFRKDLPVPRLEMIHSGLGEYGSSWIYGIVRQTCSYLEIEEGFYNFTPLSRTTISQNNLVSYDKINRPHRDTINIKFDVVALGYPAYITCPEHELIEEIEVDQFYYDRHKEKI